MPTECNPELFGFAPVEGREVVAAFDAGVKPSAIARQFGISQSDVRKALAQGTRRET